jgi:hypothetical protein
MTTTQINEVPPPATTMQERDDLTDYLFSPKHQQYAGQHQGQDLETQLI